VPRLERGTDRAPIVWAQRGHMPSSPWQCVRVCVHARAEGCGLDTHTHTHTQNPAHRFLYQLIHNRQSLEATKTPFGRWVDE
jgi:hypothetical protein